MNKLNIELLQNLVQQELDGEKYSSWFLKNNDPSNLTIVARCPNFYTYQYNSPKQLCAGEICKVIMEQFKNFTVYGSGFENLTVYGTDCNKGKFSYKILCCENDLKNELKVCLQISCVDVKKIVEKIANEISDDMPKGLFIRDGHRDLNYETNFIGCYDKKDLIDTKTQKDIKNAVKFYLCINDIDYNNKTFFDLDYKVNDWEKVTVYLKHYEEYEATSKDFHHPKKHYSYDNVFLNNVREHVKDCLCYEYNMKFPEKYGNIIRKQTDVIFETENNHELNVVDLYVINRRIAGTILLQQEKLKKYDNSCLTYDLHTSEKDGKITLYLVTLIREKE